MGVDDAGVSVRDFEVEGFEGMRSRYSSLCEEISLSSSSTSDPSEDCAACSSDAARCALLSVSTSSFVSPSSSLGDSDSEVPSASSVSSSEYCTAFSCVGVLRLEEFESLYDVLSG